MVKLPREEPAPVREIRVNPNFYSLFLPYGPTCLLQLEHMATTHMNAMAPLSDSRQYFMNRIRRLFNLEFKMRCGSCGTAHYQDEISAPER